MRLVRRAASSSAATGCRTAAAGAAVAFACRRRARCARTCCTSSTQRRSAGTWGATSRSTWRAARCGGPACRQRSWSMVPPARRVSASRPTACHWPACYPPYRSPSDAAGVSACTCSSCRSPSPATTFCRCAHRPPEWARAAGPDLHRRESETADGGAQLGRIGAASAFWTGLHAALVLGSTHHHAATSKVERVNSAITDVVRSFRQRARRRLDGPRAATGYTPFYADRGQHPRRPRTPPPHPTRRGPARRPRT